MKNFKKFAALFLAVCTLMTFVACGGGTTETPTDPATQPETEAEVTVAPETGTPETDLATEAPTEEPTEAPTEPPFEAPEEAPDTNSLLTFFDTPKNAELLDGKLYGSEIVTDEDGAPVLKLFTEGKGNFRDPYVKVDYAAYMELLGMEPVAWNHCGYAVVTLKVEGVTNNKLEMVLTGTDGTDTAKIKGESTYVKQDGWQTIRVPLVTTQKDGFTLESIRVDFVDRAAGEGETVYIRSIAFTSDKLEVLELMGKELITPSYATVTIPGLTQEYTFLQITDTHVSAFSDEDAKAWTTDRVNYNTARRNAFAADGLYSEERFLPLFAYGDEIGADGLFLTGDLIDFPSEKNISMLYDAVKSTKAKSIFCLGNHDWTFADDYMTQNAVTTYIPRFAELTGGDPYISVQEYDEFLVVAVDNSTDVITQATVDKFLALYEKNKPIILLLHVPLHADTLEADVRKAWGNRNITMGPGAMGSDWGSVQQFYNAVCVAEDTPVVAVFAGHVHFNHEDTFPNGVTQYITSTGYTGDCRIITVKGEETGA